MTGAPVRVLAVKGSGGDLRSIGDVRVRRAVPGQARTADRRATAAKRTKTRWSRFYPLCAFGENRVAASIDTPLHAFLPFDHVDHLHPDWAIALAASANGAPKLEEFNARYGRRIVWVPWQRPGFELAHDAAPRGRGRNPDATASCSAATACSRGATRSASATLNSMQDDRSDGRVRRGSRARREPAAVRRRRRDGGCRSRSNGGGDSADAARRGVVEPPGRSRTSTRRTMRVTFANSTVGRRAVPDWARAVRITSCGRASVRCSCRGIRQHEDVDALQRRIGEQIRAVSRRIRGVLQVVAQRLIRRRCATRTRRWSSFPGSASSASARTSARRGSRRSSSSTPST